MSNFWIDDLTRIERLRELAAEGLTSSEIAAKLNITRNAVIGKCRRLGVMLLTPAPFHRVDGRNVRNPHFSAKTPRRRKKKMEKHPLLERPSMRHVEETHERPVIPSSLPKSGGCLWPMWENEPNGKFCGEDRIPERSYCAAHYVIAHLKKEKVSA